MKVLTYEAHNIMRVSDVKFDMAGRHLYLIGGKNGAGKTSAITALLMALCGRSGTDYPEVALKAGDDKGWVKVTLSGDEELHEPVGITVELYLRRKRDGQVVEEFRVLDSAGEEAPEPRTLLKRLCAMRGFDPLAFERMDRKAKRELLAKLLGLDFTAEKQAYNSAYSERTACGGEGKKLKASYDTMPHYADAPAEEVSVESLMAELERRQNVNKDNAAKRKEAADLHQEEFSLKQSALACVEDLAKARQKVNDLQLELERKQMLHEQARTSLNSKQEAVAALTDADEQEVRSQIKTSGEINAKVRANRSRQDKAKELESARASYEGLQKSLDAIQEQMKAKLQAAPWPVPGLSLDDDGVLLDGLPIEQACKSRRIDVSVEIGMALNPNLRLLVCQDGNDLDYQSLDVIEKKLIAHEFQMILEFVTRNAEDEAQCAVIIRDGAVQPVALETEAVR